MSLFLQCKLTYERNLFLQTDCLDNNLAAIELQLPPPAFPALYTFTYFQDTKSYLRRFPWKKM